MWCIKCQADVAAEMAPDNRQILCASCGSRIRAVPLLPTEDKTRQARELLERWSKTRWTDEDAPAGGSPQSPPIPETSTSRPPQTKPPSKPLFRVDEPHPENVASETASPVSQQQMAQSEPAPAPQPVRTQPMPSQSAPFVNPPMPEPGSAMTPRMHEPHGPSYPPPHFSNEPLAADDEPIPTSSSSKLQAFWGQMLAYAGVLALTIGAAFVLLGYFGGPQWQSYTPTGWLITTTGQMLLFLGVVTLVSGGMEQTAEVVARRIDRLGQRIIRIEWASQNHALKGPSLPAEQFQPGHATTTNQTAQVSHQPQKASTQE